MLDGDTLAERFAEDRRDRRRQRDFGDEHQRAAAVGAHAYGETQVELGFAAAGDAVEQRDAEGPSVGQRAKAVEGRGLFGGQCVIAYHFRLGSDPKGRRGAARLGSDPERVAVEALGQYADIAMAREARDRISCNAARRERRRRAPLRHGRQQRQRLPLFCAQTRVGPFRRRTQRFEANGRDRRDAPRLVRIDARAAGHRRQERRDRIADAGGVVLRRPARERQDVRRHERRVIEHAPDVFDVRGRRRALAVRDHDTGDDAGPERHFHARADRGEWRAVGHGVCQEIEPWNRNGD